jgi:hypothetical protein
MAEFSGLIRDYPDTKGPILDFNSLTLVVKFISSQVPNYRLMHAPSLMRN